MGERYLHRAIFEAKLNELERLFHELLNEIIKSIQESDEKTISEMEPFVDLLLLSVKKMKPAPRFCPTRDD